MQCFVSAFNITISYPSTLSYRTHRHYYIVPIDITMSHLSTLLCHTSRHYYVAPLVITKRKRCLCPYAQETFAIRKHLQTI
jgi:hypothetical protein